VALGGRVVVFFGRPNKGMLAIDLYTVARALSGLCYRPRFLCVAAATPTPLRGFSPPETV